MNQAQAFAILKIFEALQNAEKEIPDPEIRAQVREAYPALNVLADGLTPSWKKWQEYVEGRERAIARRNRVICWRCKCVIRRQAVLGEKVDEASAKFR